MHHLRQLLGPAATSLSRRAAASACCCAAGCAARQRQAACDTLRCACEQDRASLAHAHPSSERALRLSRVATQRIARACCAAAAPPAPAALVKPFARRAAHASPPHATHTHARLRPAQACRRAPSCSRSALRCAAPLPPSWLRQRRATLRRPGATPRTSPRSAGGAQTRSLWCVVPLPRNDAALPTPTHSCQCCACGRVCFTRSFRRSPARTRASARRSCASWRRRG
jgi:hypothetical protein